MSRTPANRIDASAMHAASCCPLQTSEPTPAMPVQRLAGQHLAARCGCHAVDVTLWMSQPLPVHLLPGAVPRASRTAAPRCLAYSQRDWRLMSRCSTGTAGAVNPTPLQV